MKKKIILLTLVALVAGMVTPVAARSDRTPERLEKITFIHYAQPEWGPYGGACPVGDDGDTNETFHTLYGGIRWLGAVDYSFDGSVDSAHEAEINAAFAAWSGFDESDEFSASEDSSSANVISFDPIDGSGGILAVTTIWFNPATKEISRFSMSFDSDDTWSASGESDKFDVQNVTAHEVGHVAGLGHDNSPKDCWLTLYRYSRLGEISKRNLGRGDELGLQWLY